MADPIRLYLDEDAQRTSLVWALRTVQVEGVKVDESGPTLGVALEPGKDRMVWVLVNPQ